MQENHKKDFLWKPWNIKVSFHQDRKQNKSFGWNRMIATSKHSFYSKLMHILLRTEIIYFLFKNFLEWLKMLDRSIDFLSNRFVYPKILHFVNVTDE